MSDDTGRILLVETKTTEKNELVASLAAKFRYQLSNHPGSVATEVDESDLVISYEEYSPYGVTTYRAANSAIEVEARRYRYTSKERDDESGLYYYGARYYAPWLGRWTAADSIGLAGEGNLYSYARRNPVVFNDPTGLAPPKDPPTEFTPETGAIDTEGEPMGPEPPPILGLFSGLPTSRDRFLADVESVGEEVTFPSLSEDRFDANNDVGGSTVKSLERFANENVFQNFARARSAIGDPVALELDRSLALPGSAFVDLDLAFVIASRESGRNKCKTSGIIDTFNDSGLGQLFARGKSLVSAQLVPPEFVARGDIEPGANNGRAAQIPASRLLAFTVARVGIAQQNLEDAVLSEFFAGDVEGRLKARELIENTSSLARRTLTALTLQRPFGGAEFDSAGIISSTKGAGIVSLLRAINTSGGSLEDVLRLPELASEA